MRKITGIMACDQHHVISNRGKLPWNCPEEVVFYRSMIKNQIVIMGYKTYQQMPDSFFENHATVVFSKQNRNRTNPLITIVSSLDEFYDLRNLPEHKQCYMVGGAEMATLFLKSKAIDDFYLSEIEGYFPGDVFFPMNLMDHCPRTIYRKGSGFTAYYYDNLKE